MSISRLVGYPLPETVNCSESKRETNHHFRSYWYIYLEANHKFLRSSPLRDPFDIWNHRNAQQLCTTRPYRRHRGHRCAPAIRFNEVHCQASTLGFGIEDHKEHNISKINKL